MPARETKHQPSRRAATRRAEATLRRPGSASSFSSSRERIVVAMRELACENGYHAVSARNLIARARVSSKTFYENFADTNECFIAAYDQAMAEIESVMRPAYMRPGSWTQRLRAALEALLLLLESDRDLAMLVFLEAPKARELLGSRRARVLEILQIVLDSGRSGEGASETPALIDELLVEGAISVIRARVAAREKGSLVRVLDELMGVIIYSYAGGAARDAGTRRTSVARSEPMTPGEVVAGRSEPRPDGRRRPRMTYRTLRVLTALAEQPGASNRVIAEAAGINDPGQTSKLLRRLAERELIRDEGVQRYGLPKSWHLTESGHDLQRRGQRDLEMHEGSDRS